MNHSFRNFAFVASLLVPLMAASSMAARVTTAKTDAGNLYLSGDEVRIADPVAGDLFAAGRRVAVERPVGADAAIGGGTVDIKTPIGQDLRVAGGTVTIGALIGGDLIAAGRAVNIARPSTVSGSALIAGREVVVDGKLGHGAKIYAGKISVSGQIIGDTRLYGEAIDFAPGAKIDGDLTYASRDPLSAAQLALVSGKVVREKTPENWKPASDRPAQSAAWFHPGFFLSMLVCGSLLYLTFPNAVVGARQTIKRYPLRSLLIGLALLFMLPPLAILFMVTLVGIPIGLALLALYPILLLLGYLGAAFFIGREAAAMMKQPKDVTTGKQIAFLAAALLILAIAAMIPVLGPIAIFLALVTGAGGWVVWLHQRYRGDSGESIRNVEV